MMISIRTIHLDRTLQALSGTILRDPDRVADFSY